MRICELLLQYFASIFIILCAIVIRLPEDLIVGGVLGRSRGARVRNLLPG